MRVQAEEQPERSAQPSSRFTRRDIAPMPNGAALGQRVCAQQPSNLKLLAVVAHPDHSLNQKDSGYTLDPGNVDSAWDKKAVRGFLAKLLAQDEYELAGRPLTRVGGGLRAFNRSQTFGFQNSLIYQIVANWVIAEHDVERFWRFEAGAPRSKEVTDHLFTRLEQGGPHDSNYSIFSK